MAFCNRCQRSFKSAQALEQHVRNSPNHHICTCNRDFTTEHGRIQHLINSPFHFYCQDCDEDFSDDDELEEHLEDEHWYCSSCSQIFSDEEDLLEHYSDAHWYCRKCRRMFQNESNLNTHLRSSIHRPRRIKCPGRACSSKFISESGLVHHCESGACPSRVTRQAVNRVIASIDRGNIITDANRMIASSTDVTIQTWATGRSWNGDAYECFLCHREFRSLSALNQHLQSPAHEDNLYRCPPAWSGCSAKFTTLSGLVQHVESEACGVKRLKRRFNKVINDVASGLRMLSL